MLLAAVLMPLTWLGGIMADVEGASKPDLKSGVSLDGLADGGMLVGRVDDEDVILARRGTNSSQSVRIARTQHPCGRSDRR